MWRSLRKKQWLGKRGVMVGVFFLGLLLYLAWASDRADVAVRDSALVRLGEQVAVSGTLVNRGDRAFSRVAVEVAFFDADHRKIGGASAVVPKLQPRSEIRFSTEPAPHAKAAHYQVTLPALKTPYGN